MKQMVMLIMTNPDACRAMLEAWDEAGAPGITLLASTGLQTIRQSEMRDDVSFMPSLSSLFRTKEQLHRTMFSVVDDEAMAERLLAVTAGVFKQYEVDKEDVSAFAFVLPVSDSRAFTTSRAQHNYSR